MTLDNLLFTELVFRYDLTKKAIYKDEMIKRLKFCNFDNKSIDCIIELELNIINNRHIHFDENMMDIFSWTNYISNYSKNPNFKLFNLPLDNYAQIDNQEVLNSTLTLGEIAILYADAQMLNEYQEIIDIPQNMKNEIEDFALDKNNCISKLKLIYNGKFDLVYMINNNCYPSREFYILSSRFFRNEAQIVINTKWIGKYGFNLDNKIISYKPYTIDYFNFFELK